MAQQTIGSSRLAQRTSAAIANANFDELYARSTIVSATLTAAGSFVVPAGYEMETIIFANTTANAVTGGLKFGTSAGGTQVVTAQAVGANAIGHVPGANITLKVFSKTVDQTVYVDAVTGWNSASVDLRIPMRKVY